MRLRTIIVRALAAIAIVFTALLTVGLTAAEDGPFSIAIRPVFIRLEESRARALGVDVDVKLGPVHFHAAWSAIPVRAASTNPGPGLF